MEDRVDSDFVSGEIGFFMSSVNKHNELQPLKIRSIYFEGESLRSYRWIRCWVFLGGLS